MRTPDDPVNIKERVMKVVEEQRSRKDWMRRDFCPADSVPQALRRPKAAAKECAGDPFNCLKNCDDGDADSCFELAQLMQKHDTVENDVADVLYRTSCRLGIASGCTNAASMLFEASDQTSLQCAARTFELSCNANDAWACTMFGLAALDGVGREKSAADALRYFDRACEVAMDKNGQPCAKGKGAEGAG